MLEAVASGKQGDEMCGVEDCAGIGVSMVELKVEDLNVGHVYSAKRPQTYGFSRLLGDRQILWIGMIYDNKEGFVQGVQYDSPSVKDGRHYPKTSITKFLKWADADITEIMPKGEWRKG